MFTQKEMKYIQLKNDRDRCAGCGIKFSQMELPHEYLDYDWCADCKLRRIKRYDMQMPLRKDAYGKDS